MNKKISTALFVLAVIVGSTNLSAHNISFEQDLMYEKMAGSFIEQQIVELEEAIELQRENNWTSPDTITEKIEDVVGGIANTYHTAADFDWVTMKQENLFRKISVRLWGRDGIEMMTIGRKSSLDKLRDVFNLYHAYSTKPSIRTEVSEEDRGNLIRLSSDLRKSGFEKTGNAPYMDESDFYAAVKTLYALQIGEEGTVTAQRVAP